MSQQYAIDSFQHDMAYAKIIRVGRWTWQIRLLVPISGTVNGIPHMTFDTVRVLGRRRAMRVAEQMIDRYVRERLACETFEVHRDIRKGE